LPASFSRLAGQGQRPVEGLDGSVGGLRGPPKAKVTRSNRVGCAGKARAERAGAVAGRNRCAPQAIYPPRP